MKNGSFKKFGKRLYEIFFKSYTEKVWRIPCKSIDATWATQRIKNLDLVEITKNMFRRSKNKSLVDEFFYPAKGA